MGKMKDPVKLEYIDVDMIDIPDWNPNEQSPEVFNALVENMREIGFKEPVLLCPYQKGEEKRYWAISGSHRVKAGRVLAMKRIPSIVDDSLSEDMQKFQNIRFNVLKGKLDPIKFTKLFMQLSAKHGGEATRAMMAFVDKAAFDAVFQQVKDNVPKEVKKSLENARKEIQTIDGLASILNEMFSKYGNTLDSGYMVFTYGGQSHLWIIMDLPRR